MRTSSKTINILQDIDHVYRNSRYKPCLIPKNFINYLLGMLYSTTKIAIILKILVAKVIPVLDELHAPEISHRENSQLDKLSLTFAVITHPTNWHKQIGV